jgi:hypothetical protein
MSDRGPFKPDIIHEEAPEGEINSSKTPSEFSNGTGVSLSQLRLHNLLTKDNISWIILLALAAQVFNVPDQVLLLLAGAC